MSKIIYTDAEAFRTMQACAFKWGTELEDVIPADMQQAMFGENVILVHNEARCNLSGEELDAIIAHEQAHIDLGHTELDYPSLSQEEKVKLEFEADAHAIKTVSGIHLVSGMQRVIGLIVTAAVDNGTVSVEDKESFSDFINSLNKARIEALLK